MYLKPLIYYQLIYLNAVILMENLRNAAEWI